MVRKAKQDISVLNEIFERPSESLVKQEVTSIVSRRAWLPWKQNRNGVSEPT
jgi:hypothetical protein